MIDLTINNGQINGLLSSLSNIRQSAPREFNNHQNRMGFKFRKEYNEAIKREYINRTKFLYTGTGVERVGMNTPLHNSKVKVYTNREMNLKQEIGGIDRPERGQHKPIAQAQARRGRSDLKPISPRNRMSRIDFTNPIRVGNNRQKFARTIQQAGERGERFAFLEYSNQSRGIYALKNKRKINGVWRFRIHKLYDLSKSSVIIPPHHTMRNSFNEFKRRIYMPSTAEAMRMAFQFTV